MSASANVGLGMLFVVLLVLGLALLPVGILHLCRRLRRAAWDRHVTTAIDQTDRADFALWEAEYRDVRHGR